MKPTPRPAGPVVVRGGGELASAAARLLFLAGFPVAVLEREKPLAVRRRVCLAEAVFSGAAAVEETAGRLVPASGIREAWEAGGFVPVAVDPEGACLSALKPKAVVDGRMAKAVLDTRIDQAAVVVGLGPGFVAGRDVHAVVETQRGPSLGRVIWTGPAEADTSVPSPVAGHAESRVLRAPRGGVFHGRHRIGDLVRPGEAVGVVDDSVVTAPIAGLVRGLLADGVTIRPGVKVGDIDPRGRDVDPARLSDKGRAVAAGTLEAILLALRGLAASVGS
jgi:xanthine dehydrogenase accessory factor